MFYFWHWHFFNVEVSTRTIQKSYTRINSKKHGQIADSRKNGNSVSWYKAGAAVALGRFFWRWFSKFPKALRYVPYLTFVGTLEATENNHKKMIQACPTWGQNPNLTPWKIALNICISLVIDISTLTSAQNPLMKPSDFKFLPPLQIIETTPFSSTLTP